MTFKSRKKVTKKPENSTIHIKLDLKPDEPHYDMFQFVMKERGATIAAEMVRVLIKEEYDRLHKVPFPIDDPLLKEAEKFMKEHPELAFKDFNDFLRSAARRQILYGNE